VMSIARRLGGAALPAAAFAGVLFALLPIHAEAVAWISGRADSIPALFYLAAFLSYASWRRSGAGWQYTAALGAFFLALFSKQSAITMLATLAMYDLLTSGRAGPAKAHARAVGAWLLPYVPFAGLTLGYLGLRYVLFGNAVREHQISLQTLTTFAERQATYLKTLALGSSLIGAEWTTQELGLAGRAITWLGIAVALVLVASEVRRGASVRAASAAARLRLRGLLLFFGPTWWLISVAPLAVT
jgi:hypothetical protein